jgi:flagellar protein FlaJ
MTKEKLFKHIRDVKKILIEERKNPKNMDYSVHKFEYIRGTLEREREALKEINSLNNYLQGIESPRERKVILIQIQALEYYIKNRNEDLLEVLKDMSFKSMKEKPRKSLRIEEMPSREAKPILKSVEEVKGHPKPAEKIQVPRLERSALEKRRIFRQVLEKEKLTELERKTLKRVRQRKKIPLKQREKKPNKYINLATTVFSNTSRSLVKKNFFMFLANDLIKTNMQITPVSYLSIMLLTTLISEGAALILFVISLFFSMENFPLISFATEGILLRAVKGLWMLFGIPMATFVFMYFYPAMERKSAETKINQELPFATIHMSTISGAMIEPSKIFTIIASTKEYPHLEKEFNKLINLVNVYGYDLVTALRNCANNSPSKKLSDLFNSLATTITSGGDLPDFFNKRASTLLYDYRLEREKFIKFAETFMDIYISIVIAAPMILMLLLLMMRLGGLGISLSPKMITIIMILGVAVINVVFLAFLRLKQPAEY